MTNLVHVIVEDARAHGKVAACAIDACARWHYSSAAVQVGCVAPRDLFIYILKEQ